MFSSSIAVETFWQVYMYNENGIPYRKTAYFGYCSSLLKNHFHPQTQVHQVEVVVVDLDYGVKRKCNKLCPWSTKIQAQRQKKYGQ